MILDRELTEAEQRSAQRVLRDCVALSACASSCSSETLLILTAVSIGIPGYLLSASGSLVYMSYLVLPLGFLYAARVGSGRCIGDFKMLQGIFCLLIGLSLFVPAGAAYVFLAGVILLYASMSCAASMIFPLEKNISTEKTIAAMLSRNQITASVAGLTVSLLIVWLLTVYPSRTLLPLVFLTGFLLCLVCGFRIRRIDEPAILQRFAEHSILKQALLAWRNPVLRRQIWVGCLLNLLLAMLLPVNILMVKQGYDLPDSWILLLSSLQVISSIAGSWLCRVFTQKYGPRRAMIAAYPLVWAICLSWQLASPEFSLPAVLPPFIMAGLLNIFLSTSLNNYFTVTIPNQHQIGGTFWVFLATGGLMGLLGMFLNPAILAGIQNWFPGAPFRHFQLYFLFAGILFAAGILAPVSLPESSSAGTAEK